MALRITLRKGDKGKFVSELQKLLNKILASRKLTADGDFGENTRKAVIDFQKSANIKADGIVGNRTWVALANAATHIMTAPMQPNGLSSIAEKYIGVKETGNNLAGSSKQMLEIFKADDLVINGKTDGYPWCAAFVSLCVQKLCKSSVFYSSLVPPREPSVNNFLNSWAKNSNCLIFKPDSKVFTITKDDIVVFTFSHIGIVESSNDTFVTTIEGNTNDAGSREGITVARKQRRPSIIRSVIRLPMDGVGIDRKLNDYVQYC